MKNLLLTLTICSILWSCGGGGGEDPPPPPPPVNKAPTVPSLVYPTDNLLCIENPVECKWNASTDSDVGDVITYQIEVAENSTFTQNKQTFNGTSLTQSVPLLENVAYYWRVKATDGKASSNYSSVYKFYTYGEGITNHLPFSPLLVNPELNAVEQEATTTLEWTASDVDNDPLTFNIFFDTVNPPTTKVGDNQSATTLDVTLDPSTNYYWKVVVKDDKGGQTIGQIWNFQTD